MRKDVVVFISTVTRRHLSVYTSNQCITRNATIDSYIFIQKDFLDVRTYEDALFKLLFQAYPFPSAIFELNEWKGFVKNF